MKKLTTCLSLLLLLSANTHAQYVHLTQYLSAPLLFNPAMTGLVTDDFRATANYRSQWSSVSPDPYITGTMSFDMAMLRGKLPKGDALGVGAIGLYDKNSTGSLINKTAGLSISYHKALGKDHAHHISLGVQGLLVNKHLKTDHSVFNAPPVVIDASIAYPDYNMGIMYSGKISTHTSLYAGYTNYHLTRHIETYSVYDQHEIRPRHSLYAGATFDLSSNVVLYTNGLYQAHAGAQEFILGTSAGFVLNPSQKQKTTLYVGGWCRYQDAVAPYISVELAKIRLGLSYDINISSFTPSTRSVGAYEISLSYNGLLSGRSNNTHWHCPKLY